MSLVRNSETERRTNRYCLVLRVGNRMMYLPLLLCHHVRPSCRIVRGKWKVCVRLPSITHISKSIGVSQWAPHQTAGDYPGEANNRFREVTMVNDLKNATNNIMAGCSSLLTPLLTTVWQIRKSGDSHLTGQTISMRNNAGARYRNAEERIK